MGTSASRNQVSTTRRSGPANSYRHPPEDGGHYFSSHYYLGHRKFATGEPELFLFGDLPDLNYLPSTPTTFPYKQPGKSQPVACLRSLINLQRESVKLVRAEGKYTLEFTFDCDVDCSFTILRDLPDTISLSELNKDLNISDEDVTVSPTFRYAAGSDQQFQQSDYIVTPADIDTDKLTYDPENDQHRFPLVILMQTTSDLSNVQQAQLTMCSVEQANSSNTYSLKVLKQKLLVDDVEYLLQEVYGLENKAKEDGDDDDSDIEEDLGAECVICITDTRDTILLPCRHLCLCNSCAANLRYQSSNCPICRAPFRALLQIQALEPLDPDLQLDDDDVTGNPKYSTPGYQCVPLLQALNGYQLEDKTDTGPELQPVTDGNEETSSPQQQQQLQRGSDDVCVVPIEDETLETDTVSPAPEQPPTTVTPAPDTTRQSKHHEVSCLPGTPVNDHTVISLDAESYCSSSVSSEVSVRSSDRLLPAAKN